MTDIAVIVPTYNRARLLRECLTSLLRQTIAPARYEICVVNNRSTDDTAHVVADLIMQYPAHQLSMIDEAQRGLTPARNRGLAHITASLVAFGDDDTILPPDWLEHFLQRFAALPDNVVKVGGAIEPIWDAPRPAWLSDKMLCLLSACSSIRSADARLCFPGKGEALVECNCCYRRGALQNMGGFPVDLGRKGENLLSGENAVDYRLAAAGYGFFYDPAIVIRHRIHAERLTPEWFRRRYFWQGVTDFAVRAYLQQFGLTLPASHTVQLPMSPDDWNALSKKDTADFDDTLRKLRGMGFMLAMMGVVGE